MHYPRPGECFVCFGKLADDCGFHPPEKKTCIGYLKGLPCEHSLIFPWSSWSCQPRIWLDPSALGCSMAQGDILAGLMNAGFLIQDWILGDSWICFKRDRMAIIEDGYFAKKYHLAWRRCQLPVRTSPNLYKGKKNYQGPWSIIALYCSHLP